MVDGRQGHRTLPRAEWKMTLCFTNLTIYIKVKASITAIAEEYIISMVLTLSQDKTGIHIYIYKRVTAIQGK